MGTKNTPQPKYLKDYKTPDFNILGIELNFDIHDGKTTVTAKTSFARVNKTVRHLALDGENMTLKSVSLDGALLSAKNYSVNDHSLTISDVPDNFTLEIVTEICPETNTTLDGLYNSSGNYCTQCEPEGFRKITYYPDRPDVMTTFTTRIEADKTTHPVLLSNGNLTDKGDLSHGRHFAVWHDPFAKPCYLFALVAGKLAHIHDTFMTMSGRKVDLYIYINPGNEDKCQHAMDSLKKSMKWDEDKYGREYDLDIFNIVAVNDFNFGAMENKSLNIFNAKLVLARPDTATDGDFLAIEGVVAHEYFHNWTGNRITCRDWFQLSLKEGLTVFRDQSFSGDVNSEAVQRIDDVEGLRNVQFVEDAGPLAHSVRPDNYIEINNFYTATVYEKGAEVIRMIHTLLGAEKFRKGTDLYFKRHDGQAVTCDDFAQCMQDASGIDLSQFKLWYSQAGTPEVTAEGRYDADRKTFTLTLSQKLPDTPGQKNKRPMHIPVAVGLLDKKGKDILPETTRILHLEETEQSFIFDNIAEKPVPSILRNFSAPVKLNSDLSEDDLLFLMAHDSDGFNRWDAGQTCFQRLILSKATKVPEKMMSALGKLITDKKADKALLAKALTLPSENYLSQLETVIDIDGLYESRKELMREIGARYLAEFKEIYHANNGHSPYSTTPLEVGKRRLKATSLRYIQAAGATDTITLAIAQYETSHNMTDKVTALSVLADTHTNERRAAFDDFYRTWQHDPLVLDKWFSMQAFSDRPDTFETVLHLTQHPDFSYKNPNRLRALMGTFCMGNQKWFHRKDGAAYKLLADTIIVVNRINPSTAARLLTPLRQWKRYDPVRRALMKRELGRILAEKDISNDVYEIASKSLS